MNRDKTHRSLLVRILLIILFVLIFLSLSIIISMPRIQRSLNTSGVIPLIKNHLHEREKEQKELLLSLYFPIPSSVDSTYRYTSTSVMVQNDSHLGHHFIEELLKVVPQGALIEGAVSFIPPRTTLIGYSVSHKVGYVHLSEEFLNPTSFEIDFTLRIDQIKKNLRENFSLSQIVVIVNGEIIP